MALSASQIYAQITLYKNLKSQLNNLKANLENCNDMITSASQYTENIIISNQAVDEGKLSSAQDSVSNILAIVVSAIAECNEKITTFQEQYNRMTTNDVKTTDTGSKPSVTPIKNQNYVILHE